MSDLLREALRDLGDQGRLRRSHVELARSSWAAGRRRRFRQRLAVLGAGAAVLGLLVLVVPLVRSARVQPAAPGPASGVSSYPAYIGSGRPTVLLPARPGPIAGVLEDDSYGDDVNFYAVTGNGVRWRIRSSDVLAPRLSPDGRWLLTVTGRPGRFALTLHDLVGGISRPIPYERPPQVHTPGDVPDEWVYWSPDDDAHVLSGRARRLLDLRTGHVTTLPTTGVTAGLATGGRAVTVSYTNGRRVRPITDVRAHVVDLATGRVRDVDLRPTRPWVDTAIRDGQATVSPNGSALVVASSESSDLHYFSLATGRETATFPVEYAGRPYPFVWADGQLTVPTGGQPGGSASGKTVLVTADGPRTLVLIRAADASVTPIVTWAADAISGTPHRTPWGMLALWWSVWGGRALVAAALLAAAVGWLIVVRGHRSLRS